MWILNFIDWNVSPEIFSIGSVVIRYYGLLFATGFTLSFYIVQKYFKDAGIDIKEVDTLTLYTIGGAIIGARLGHILFYEFDYYSRFPAEILKIWHGGLASHGGVIGLLITTYIYSRKAKLPYLWLTDRIAAPAALTGALIRIGNLMNSEIYGTTTDLPWGFVFMRNGETLAKHPTQIYEAIIYFIIFALLIYIYFKDTAKVRFGKLTGIFMIGIFSARIIIEFLKNNQVDFEASMLLNMGQILSIPLILIGIILVYKSYSNPKQFS